MTIRERINKWLGRIPALGRSILVAGVIIFISLLYPNRIQFKYEFKLNEIWKYENLIAPFDFAINKDPEVLAAEMEQAKANLSPFYRLDPRVKEKEMNLFEAQFKDQLEQGKSRDQFQDVASRPQVYLRYGKEYLDYIYSRGVIALAPEHAAKGKGFVVMVVNGNEQFSRTLENFLRPEVAKAMLNDSLPNAPLAEPEFLYPLLEKRVRPNLHLDNELTQKAEQEALSSVSPTRGKVKEGELIVQKGGTITEETYRKLDSYRAQYLAKSSVQQARWGIFGGHLVLTCLIIGLFLIYVSRVFPDIWVSFRKMAFILMWFAVYSYLVYLTESSSALSAYIIPFCIVPIVLSTFYNQLLALFTHLILVLVASFLTSEGYEFTVIQILAGIAVVLTNVNTRDWSKFFSSIAGIFLVYAIGFMALSVIQSSSFAKIDYQVFVWLFVNSFLTLLAYPLIPLLERLFGFTSSITLVELSDMNRPLLRQMAVKAPGTLQHSIQVSNLAEEAAHQIEGDALLVKVGALYHDIGKTKQPGFFIENQGDQGNPHDELPPLESARIIIEHVMEGIRMARKERLPRKIIDFIATHHGTTRVSYFFKQHQEAHPLSPGDPAAFQYPGPKPKTKEQTILMLADSVEAACKSLKKPTGQDIDQMVDRIFHGKIEHGQLEESELTFSELVAIKEVFRGMLRSIHHIRVEYPKEETADKT